MTKAEHDHSFDYYSLLSVSSSATSTDIKAAYHRSLLASHPDKHSPGDPAAIIDIGLLKDAFTTLYTPELRKEYDKYRDQHNEGLSSRPAQVISLEDFEEVSNTKWTHPCRCGGIYLVTEDMLDAGKHILGCVSCSEVVWVGYELLEGEEDPSTK